MAFAIGQKLTAVILNDFDPSGHVHAGTDLTVATTATVTGVLTALATNNRVANPYGHFYQSVAQTLTTSVDAAITMTSEVIDTINGHSTSVNTSRYTPTVGGWYFCLGMPTFAGNVTGDRKAQFRKNGNVVNEASYGSAAGLNGAAFLAGVCFAAATIQCNGSTDYIELWASQNSGGNLNTDVANPGHNSFMICEWKAP